MVQAQDQAAENCPSPAGDEVLHPAPCFWALIHSLSNLHAESSTEQAEMDDRLLGLGWETAIM